jgi:hypothetical protein
MEHQTPHEGWDLGAGPKIVAVSIAHYSVRRIVRGENRYNPV